MPKIIQNDRVVDDDWPVFHLAAAETADTVVLPAEPALWPLRVWLARRDEIVAHYPRLGVWLDGHEDPQILAADLDRLAVIGVHFPKFTDGRGYSTARLLRERYHYRGEIRALGDVLQDQLFFMRRCGIDAYALRADKDIDKALAGLRVFTESYQAAVDSPLPLFARRLAQETQ